MIKVYTQLFVIFIHDIVYNISFFFFSLFIIFAVGIGFPISALITRIKFLLTSDNEIYLQDTYHRPAGVLPLILEKQSFPLIDRHHSDESKKDE